MLHVLLAADSISIPIELLPLLSALGVAVLGGLFAIYLRFRTSRDAQKVPLPPTWPQMWERMDRQDEKLAALGRLLVAVAEQWPADTPPPTFDDADLALLEDTMVPVQWRPRRRRPPAARPTP